MGNPIDFELERDRLVRQLRLEIKDERVLQAMSKISRELFVPEESRPLAYEDRPLPIGFGQTISQPLIVAMMTEALQLKGTEKVLEIGTGSGYQAAILAELASLVISVERLPELVERTQRNLAGLGHRNIEVHLAGPFLGWPSAMPYDAIVVTAGAPKVPPGLVEQLGEGGRLVIPVGSRYEQDLLKVTRQKKGLATEVLGGCRFVPLIGGEAWQDEDMG